MIWPFVIFLGTFLAKLNFDLWQFYRKRTINHPLEAVGVAILLGLAALMLSGWDLKNAALPFLMFLFVFWAAFDTTWNLFVGNPVLYTGTKARLDRLQNKYPFIKVVKFVGATISTFVFTLVYGFKLFKLPTL